MLKSVLFLVKKDLALELRQKATLGGIGLYVVSTVYISYLSFHKLVETPIWNALFWIILLFGAFNATASSFANETSSRRLYLYTLAPPQAVILSKIIVNSLMILALGILNLACYSLFLGSAPLQGSEWTLFLLAVLLGCLGFAATLTMISGIASQTNNNLALTAILGLPVILPLLLVLLRFSKNILDGISWSVNQRYCLILAMLILLVSGLSYLLFPYLWRD